MMGAEYGMYPDPRYNDPYAQGFYPPMGMPHRGGQPMFQPPPMGLPPSPYQGTVPPHGVPVGQPIPLAPGQLPPGMPYGAMRMVPGAPPPGAYPGYPHPGGYPPYGGPPPPVMYGSSPGQQQQQQQQHPTNTNTNPNTTSTSSSSATSSSTTNTASPPTTPGNTGPGTNPSTQSPNPQGIC